MLAQLAVGRDADTPLRFGRSRPSRDPGRSLARTQSTKSLQRLLRYPLGYVWRYALGWRSIRLEGEPFQLDPIAFGELVHELIAGAITRL
jgi:hypothetical protein